jgi:hypothetical protein
MKCIVAALTLVAMLGLGRPAQADEGMTVISPETGSIVGAMVLDGDGGPSTADFEADVYYVVFQFPGQHVSAVGPFSWYDANQVAAAYAQNGARVATRANRPW